LVTAEGVKRPAIVQLAETPIVPLAGHWPPRPVFPLVNTLGESAMLEYVSVAVPTFDTVIVKEPVVPVF
jgi:hypothetical protein